MKKVLSILLVISVIVNAIAFVKMIDMNDQVSTLTMKVNDLETEKEEYDSDYNDLAENLTKMYNEKKEYKLSWEYDGDIYSINHKGGKIFSNDLKTRTTALDVRFE